MSQVVHNSGIAYGNNNRYCGNTTSYNRCNISIPDEKRQILEWISPFASRERHQAVRDSRVEKVGDWLLCNRSFSTWSTSEDGKAKPVLFCYGHPGAGKTYISSLVIDTLSNGIAGIDEDGVAVAYVYCDFSIRNMQSTSAVLGSVLRQVVGALTKIPDEAQQAFKRAKKQTDGCGLRLPEILDMLTKFLPNLNRAFICIDALDEFPTKQRAQLWNSLQRVVRECPNTRLFLTGRPQIKTEVDDCLAKKAEMIAIEPTLEDIRRYIEERLNEDLDKSTINEELREDIRSVIPKRVDGIFLLVCLGMDAIFAATTVYQKRQALDRMANGLGLQDAYNTTLDRIRQQDGGKSKLGMAVLMWVSRSERPLRWRELRHALGVDLVAGEFTADNVPSVRTVLGCTLGLVTIDENASTVRLLHLTLQEYLGTSPTVFKAPQSMMAETCLTYLNSLSFQAPQGDLDIAVAESPFLEYATRFWGTHADREVTEEVKSRALQLLDGYESHVSATILLRKKELWGQWSGKIVYGISGLHCIAFLGGIAEIAIAMLEAKKWDVNGRDSRGDTPLMWAVRYGNDRMVELLLEQGDTRPDVTIRDGRTVLSFAAESGNEGAVELLLECGGVNPDSSGSNGRTPLSFAAQGGHGGVVKLFLQRGDVNPDSPDSVGRTPLSLAVQRGHKSVVKLLLGGTGVNPNSPDSSGRAPLSYALISQDEGVVKLLLECQDIDPNSLDSEGQTPLSFAALRGHEGVVKLLLGHKDINPDLSDSGGRTPLSFAAISGAVGVVDLLVKHQNVNPDSPDSCGLTPLSFAALGRHEGVVKLLLGCGGVNPNSPDSYGLTPLSYAAILQDEDVVKLLYERGSVNPNLPGTTSRTPLSFSAISGAGGVGLLLERVDLNRWGNDGRTLLLFAAWVGDKVLVGLLLECIGVNPKFADSNLRTPLSLAASGGHEGVVKLLLQRKEVNPDSRDRNGRAPLSLAASGGHGGAVKLLLERHEVDSDSPDSSGRTPLSFAASKGHDGVVELLLERKEVNPCSRDRNGRTPLSLAASGGHGGVVKLLLERYEVNPRSRDRSGRTPLSLAASGGHGGVVKLLLEHHGVSPDSPDGSGRTPLSFAAGEGRGATVKLLLEHHEVNPDSLDGNGRTPLSFAASKGHDGVVELLLERKEVNPRSRDRNGRTPLSLAASGGHGGVVKLLLELHEVNPDSPDSSGRTPLSFAASRGHEGIVGLLLECKYVNPDSSDWNGRTPLSFAALGGHEGVVKLLLEHHGVSPDSPDRSGRTPLSFAAEGGHQGTVKLLLERREVNPDSRDSDYQTPLLFATSEEHQGVVKLLLERSHVNLNSSDNDGQAPLSYATTLGPEGEVKVSDARSSNCQSLGNPDRMPTSVTVGIVSHQEVMHPLTPTDNVTLRTPDDPPLGAPISGFAPPRKQPLPFQPSPPGQLHSRVATPIPTPTPGFILPSPSASVLSPRSTSDAAPDPAPSKPLGALRRCLRAIQKPFRRSKRKHRSSS